MSRRYAPAPRRAALELYEIGRCPGGTGERVEGFWELFGSLARKTHNNLAERVLGGIGGGMGVVDEIFLTGACEEGLFW